MKINYTPTFTRNYKALKKKKFDMSKLATVIDLLVNQEKELLIRKYRDHALKGDRKGDRELHIERDWLLVYRINNNELELILLATGLHDQVFRKSR